MDQTQLFISDFCQWANGNEWPKSTVSKMKNALRKAIDEELPRRDEKADLYIRHLQGSEGIFCSYESDVSCFFPDKEGKIAVATLNPYWRNGWREISKDEDVVDVISWFFHFSAQYVDRSRMAQVIGAIALTYDVACQFRYSGLRVYALDSVHEERGESIISLVESFGDYGKGKRSARKNSRKQKELLEWIDNINAHDPHIHRMLFHYWKSVSLFSLDFWEEGMTALDCAVDVASQLVKNRLKPASNLRESVLDNFKLTKNDRELLRRLYKIRNEFGAHPSDSKWWDFAEIYEDDLDEIRGAAKRLILQALLFEKDNRIVEPDPLLWSQWFRDNSRMLLQAVWFLKIS